MPWDCQQVFADSTPLVLPCIFTSQVLAIDVSATNKKATWYQSGYLQSSVVIDGVEFAGEKFLLGFGSQLIRIPYISYTLRFQPKEWLENTELKIKELSATQITNTIMAIGNSPVNPSADTSTVTTVNASVTAVQISAANPARMFGGLIVNKSNRIMYVRFGLAAGLVAAAPATAISANGGNIDIPDDYVGPISAIWAAGATGNCEITELLGA
jgi:ammonia channel protein AmtB